MEASLTGVCTLSSLYCNKLIEATQKMPSAYRLYAGLKELTLQPSITRRGGSTMSKPLRGFSNAPNGMTGSHHATVKGVFYGASASRAVERRYWHLSPSSR